MGEWSKSVGEYGEKTVENFLELIGWAEGPKKQSITCNRSSKHKEEARTERRTHGIDYLFSYNCPLIDGILKNAIISVKYTDDAYPGNPKEKFKEHFGELAYTIECFKQSDIRRELNRSASNINKTDDVGILFWLSNEPNTYDDLISKVSSTQLTGDYNYSTIYIVDNKRIGFLHESITYARTLYTNSNVTFYYPDTGNNININTKRTGGKSLPVEYINTSVLPMRIHRSVEGLSEIHLALFSIDSFSEADLKRLIGLAQTLSGNWASKTVILFPDYNELRHEADVRMAKSSFEDKQFTQSIEVRTFRPSFRN